MHICLSGWGQFEETLAYIQERLVPETINEWVADRINEVAAF
ncbi:hypothetical protein [Novipirellula artificiosorum]|nr:hypothetical protein [Novipirellula artificiosorum]